MRFLDDLRKGTLYKRMPQLIKLPKKEKTKKKKKRRIKEPTETKTHKKRKKSVATLSKLDSETASSIFKLHEMISQDFASVFAFMVLDLRIMFPKLPVFETRDYLSCLAPFTHSALEHSASALDCPELYDRLKALQQDSTASGNRDADLKAELCSFATDFTTLKEVTGSGYPGREQVPVGRAGFTAELVQKSLHLEGNSTTLSENFFQGMVPSQLHADLVLVPVERVEKVERTLRPMLREDGSPVRNPTPFYKPKILKISTANQKLGITFQEALWLIERCKKLRPRKFLVFTKHWERVLLNSKQWLAALCLLSAVRISTFSKYLGRLRCLHRFINWFYFHKSNSTLPIENLVDLIHRNQLREDTLIKFAQYRMNRVKFRTMRADFTALAFFFRHLPDTPVDFWNAFGKLRVVLKSLGKAFDEEAEGSIFLEWAEMKTLLTFILQLEFSDVEAQHLFDCFILSYWFALRISEACDLWFLNARILPATEAQGERLQICVVDSKTNTRETPWHIVTLNALPEPGWRMFCPVEAFRRISKRRKPGQTHLFTRTNGKPFDKSWVTKKFDTVRKAFRKAYPSIVAPGDKFTFHVFRISAIGFYIRDMGFTLYETQTISRHKIGSSTTEDVYIAKGKKAFAKSLANKIQNFIAENGTMPQVLEDQDNFLLYADSSKIARRFKTFSKPTTRPQHGPPEPMAAAPAPQLARTPSPPPSAQALPAVDFPLLQPGDPCRVPFEDQEGPPSTWEIKTFDGVLTYRDRQQGVEGFWVKFDGYPIPEFVDGHSLMECRS